MSKWREVRLGEVSEVFSGYAFKSNDFLDCGDIPVIKIGNINRTGINLKDNIVYVDDIFLQKIDSKYQVKKGDILISLTGSNINQPNSIVGRVGLYRHENISFLNQRAGKIEPKAGYSRDYIFYLYSLKSITYYVASIAYGGANQVNISPTTIKNIKIKIPDLETQEKIAQVLSSYDELIENNNRRIEILEKMAEEIYKEWFVRMRFPGHEEVSFEKGIPEGWEVKKIRELGEVITGKTPSTKNNLYYGNDILFVKTPDMHNNTFINDTEVKLSSLGSKSQINKLLPENSIMVSCIGTGGVVSINSKKAHTNQQINSIILKDIKLREWAYLTLKSMKGTIEAFGSTGATMTNLSKGKFENLKILYPTKKLLLEFNLLNEPIFSKILKLNEKNQNLIKQRDMLLPRLMNGTIEVK